MEKTAENKFGTEPEGKLLVVTGVPMMISLFVAAFYNLADTFFVSRIPGTGEAAAKALALVFPVQMLMTALNVGTGVGVAAALSLAVTASGAAALQIFAEPVAGWFQLSPEFTALCVTAIRVMTWGFPFAGLSVLLSGVCQALGGGMEALAISALRLILLVLPLAAALSRLPGGDCWVWFAFPAAEILTLAAAARMTARLYRNARKGGRPCGK